MNNMSFQNLKHSSSKHNTNKKRLTQDQVRRLETSFSFNNRLNPDRKIQLARELGIPARQIAIWYQNKRARCKTQSLEHDHEALRLRLEAAFAENRRLEREVERLEGELKAAQEMMLANLKPPAPKYYSNVCGVLSGLSDQDVSLSTCSWVENGDLEIENLYDCMAGIDDETPHQYDSIA